MICILVRTTRDTVRTEVLKYWCQEVNSGRRQGRSCGYTRVSRSIEDKTLTVSVMWVYTVYRSIEDKTQTGSVMWAHTTTGQKKM
jgi:hypothetical protein